MDQIRLRYLVIIGLNWINLVQIGSSSRSWTKSFLVLFFFISHSIHFWRENFGILEKKFRQNFHWWHQQQFFLTWNFEFWKKILMCQIFDEVQKISKCGWFDMPLRSTFEIGTQIILLKIDGFLKGWILNITPLNNCESLDFSVS